MARISMVLKSAKQFGAAISVVYDRADGVVTRLSQHSVSPLVMFFAILTTDGALAAMLDSLPIDLGNQTVPSPSYDDNEDAHLS